MVLLLLVDIAVLEKVLRTWLLLMLYAIEGDHADTMSYCQDAYTCNMSLLLIS